MTLQTQCPNCQSTYPIPLEQINNESAKARCPKCKTTFLINHNSSEQTTQQSLVPENALGSLDDMSSWLDQQAQSISEEKMINDGSVSNLDDLPQEKGNQVSTENMNDGNGEEWLDKILEQDVTENVDTSVQSANNNTDKNELNELLSTYGVNTENPEKNKVASNKTDQLSKMRERVLGDKPTQQQVVANKSPAVFFVWLLGCLLLLSLLLVQYVVFNINTLVKDPEQNSKLLGVCKLLSCKLPNADINTLTITYVKHRASFVQDDKSNTDIIGGMLNQSTDDQLYPNLKITIQGNNGLLGEFVAAPKDYLTSKQTQMAGGQDKLFMFTVPLKNEQISVVEITTFY